MRISCTREGPVWVCDWFSQRLHQMMCEIVGVCKPAFLSLHQACMYNNGFTNPARPPKPQILQTPSLPLRSILICCWRASVPLSTSESCCRSRRPLEEALWMADCGCHSLLDTRDRWTRCAARCGFRRRRPLWFCGKPGCRSSCSWCSCAASCATPGIRRCRVIRWPLWQG